MVRDLINTLYLAQVPTTLAVGNIKMVKKNIKKIYDEGKLRKRKKEKPNIPILATVAVVYSPTPEVHKP